MSHYNEIVSLIYEAVLDDSAWPRACRQLQAAASVDGIHFSIFDASAVDRNLMFSRLFVDGAPAPEIEVEYARDYAAIDERLPRVPRLPARKAFHNDSLFTEDDIRRSAVYNEFLKPKNSTNQLLVRLPSEGRPATELLVLSKYSADHWGSERMALIEKVVPHMERFLRLRRAVAQTFATTIATMLGKASIGVILTDGRGRVLECNDRASAILRAGDALVMQGRQLQPADRRNTAFRNALAQALPGDSPVGGSVRLTRGDQQRRGHLNVHIVPAHADKFDFSAERVAVLLLLIEPTASARDPSHITATFGLTEHEARVASLLAQGNSVAEIAERSHRTESTVRYHLKHAYAKTGTRRQAELVSLVLTGAA